MGPGTKLPSLGHTTFAVIRNAYQECVIGMLEGGADAVLIETSQDLLQVKAAVIAAQRAMDQVGRRIPIISHVTVETTGTMLLARRSVPRSRLSSRSASTHRPELRDRSGGDE